MQKKWIFYLGITTHMFFTYGMNNDNSLYIIKELREHILLSHDIGFLKAIVNFLGSQPTTLTKPDGHTTEIESVALYGHIAETKSWYFNEWYTLLWDIHTGEHIITSIEKCKPWEKYNSVTLNNNKAISIIPCMPYHDFSQTPKSTQIWDTQTNKKLKVFEHGKGIKSMTTDGNYVAMVLNNGQIKIWNTDNKRDSHIINPGDIATSVAINKDIIAIGLKSGTVEIRNKHTRDLIDCFTTKYSRKVTAITIHHDTILAGYRNGTAIIWDMLTRKILHTLGGPNRHTDPITSLAMNDNIAITGSEDCTAKIWPLKINLQGTTDNNPLLWIIDNANELQLNFIWRVYETTRAKQEFVIDLPKKLGVIEKNESSEQIDGRTYFTLPHMVRDYLKNRLKIRRQATTLEKIYLTIEKIMT